MHLSDQKSQLRASIDERLKNLDEKERSAESRSLCRRLTERIAQGTTVCAFFPMRSEPDITPFLIEVLRRNDPLYLPCFDGTLVFRQATDLSTLVCGKLGTLEPPTTAPMLTSITNPSRQLRTGNQPFKAAQDRQPAISLIVLVPGRAFDAVGNRLGRGNGGYDKWIQGERKKGISMRFIGVALECQIVDSVPVESHDERMDAVATARGIVGMKEEW